MRKDEIKGRESIRGNASRERSALPGRGGNNSLKNSIIGPLISFTTKRSSALCQGRVRSSERARRAVHSGASPPVATLPEIESRFNVEDFQRRFWDIVDKTSLLNEEMYFTILRFVPTIT